MMAFVAFGDNGRGRTGVCVWNLVDEGGVSAIERLWGWCWEMCL